MNEKNFCKMEFTRDEEGREILLKDGKFQVMMEWERPYMQACIDAIQPKGDVLEVGFGCGYASTHIQTYHPKSHTIIEYHPVIAQKAREWAKNYAHVRIVEDTWQNALSHLGTFDSIFFDDYPLEDEVQGEQILQTKKQAHTLIEKGKELLESVHLQLPSLKSMRYSEADIEEFLEMTETASPQMFLRFFCDLKESGQIDKTLFESTLLKLQRKGYLRAEDLEALKPAEKDPFLFRHQGDRLFQFLQLCLKNHMRPGAVFSCYLEDPTSKYEDANFFSHIITNPFLEYQEERISVEVPAHCNYYKGSEALVITITKILSL